MNTTQIVTLTILGLLIGAMCIYGMIQQHYSLDKIKRKTVGDGQYGTARWATDAEIKADTIQVPYTPKKWRTDESKRPDTAGIVVSMKGNRQKHFAVIDTKDSHTLMVSGSGGGKTTTFVIPNIEYALACGLSFVCTDSKGDLLRMYGKICEQYGHTCVNINFRSPSTSDSYNYLQLVNKYMDQWKASKSSADHSRAERYAKNIARSIVHTKGFDGGGQNAFFYDSAEGVIAAVILMASKYCDPAERHIVSVFKLLLELLQEAKQDQPKAQQKSTTKTKLHEMLNLLPPDDKIRWFAGAASQTAGQSFASVMSTAMSRLLAFIDSETEEILCYDSKVSINDICEKKVAVFITFPEEDETKHVLVSMLLSQIMNEAISYADEHTEENKLPRRLYVFADEFGIFPHMSNIVGLFGSARSRNVILVPCIQSPSQLKSTYGTDGETIIRDCCQTVIFGGFSPMSDTAVTFSKLLDTQTVAAGSVSNNSRNSFFRNDNSRSVNMISRALMTPDELQRLKFGEWIIKRRGAHPFLGHLPRYDKLGIELNDPYRSEGKKQRNAKYAACDELYRRIAEAHKPEYTRHRAAEHVHTPANSVSAADY